MSVIHVNQIASKIEGMFRQYLDLSDLNESDAEYDTKVRSRCLAAYAVYLIGDADEKAAAEAVVDGGDDNGIDAVYYSSNAKKMTLVQSKWSKNGTGEPASSDIRKFKDGVVDLFNMEFDRFNEKLRAKQVSVNEALTAFDTTFDVVLIHTGNQQLGEHSMRVIEDLLKEMNETGDENKEDILSFQ
ncbi:hypothetical protein [Pseudovibrio sp. Ad37]|uniref:hypothetical protein n=1 Tax=Pseudovibrio sp. Ad37 TaxID=989422 RepID=UPI0007B2C675|nr:hypothetical protein [Pseudovibrio sp. Ad37]KZL26999.1 hypothetical protein PsAD37_01676 [Pseudovibrio sp. Ad37]